MFSPKLESCLAQASCSRLGETSYSGNSIIQSEFLLRLGQFAQTRGSLDQATPVRLGESSRNDRRNFLIFSLKRELLTWARLLGFLICSSHAEPHKFIQHSILHNKQVQASIKHTIIQFNHSEIQFTRKLSEELASLTFLPRIRLVQSSEQQGSRIFSLT